MQVKMFTFGVSSSTLPEDGSREFLLRKTDLKIPRNEKLIPPLESQLAIH